MGQLVRARLATRLRWFVAALAGMVVLVVVALLVEAAAAHCKFRSPRLAVPRQPRCLVGNVRYLLVDPPRILHVGLALEHADLLLMRLAALPLGLARFRCLVAMRRPALPLILPVDSALRVGVVRQIAFKGVLAFDVLEIVKARLRHGDALGAADQRIAMQVDVAWPRGLAVPGHDSFPDAGYSGPTHATERGSGTALPSLAASREHASGFRGWYGMREPKDKREKPV